jgi:hypothetical protein
MVDAIRQAGETTNLRYDASGFCLRAGPERVFNLHNAYAEYQSAAPDGREAVMRRWVRGWFAAHKEVPDDFADARPDLLPVLKPRAELELAAMEQRVAGGRETDCPYRVVAGHLALFTAYDRPESMTLLPADQLKDWGVTLDEALSAACHNLTAMSDRPFESAAPGVWLSPFHDNYDAARLALPELLSHYEVRGDLVAVAPNRDVLALTGSEDEVGLGFVASLVEEQMGKPRPLSPVSVRLDDQTWLPFLPAPGSPQRERFRRLRVRADNNDYARQTELLQQLHEAAGEDVFVAGYVAAERGGEILSYCVWSEGVDTLLPRTDEVFFFQPKGEKGGDVVAAVPWDKVTTIVGELLEHPSLYPARYRVRRFPNAEELAELKSAGYSPKS